MSSFFITPSWKIKKVYIREAEKSVIITFSFFSKGSFRQKFDTKTEKIMQRVGFM